MKTLHELATKLQQYIIKSQQDAHNSTNMNITKYNNLKLRMETKLHYPNIIVTIGISEAIFNIREGTKTDGSLGPDERYVKKWLGSSSVIADLKEIYIAMSDLIKAEDENKAISMEGEADEAKKDTPRKQKFRELISASSMSTTEETESEDTDNEELLSVEESFQEESSESEPATTEPETVEQVKKGLKEMLKSMFRRK